MTELDLHLKLEKCHFATTEVGYLGMIIKPGQLAMDPVKLDGIASWPTLKRSRTSDHSLALPTSTDVSFPTIPTLLNPSLTLPRKTYPGAGPPLPKTPLTRSSPCSCRSQSYTSLTLLHPSPLPPTPPSMLLVPSFSKPTPMANGIRVPTFPSRSPQQNGTMTFTTENSLPSSTP